MSKEWRHHCCDDCWPKVAVEVCGHPFAPEPFRLKEPEIETCCWCHGPTTSGIYVRADPAELQCQAVHAEDDDG